MSLMKHNKIKVDISEWKIEDVQDMEYLKGKAVKEMGGNKVMDTSLSIFHPV